LLMKLVPNPCFHGCRVAQNDHFNLSLLTITVKPSHALVKSHWIPRQVDVHQAVAILLEVDAFTAGLRRHKEPYFPCIEVVGSILPVLSDALVLSGLYNIIGEIITVDESYATAAESLNQRRHQERLGSLVFGEE